MHFVIRNTRSGLNVAEYDAPEAMPPYKFDEAYAGADFSTFDEQGNEVTFANDFRVWSILEFKRRLTQPERVAIRTVAKENPVVEDFMDMLDSATEVRSDDPDVIGGLQLMEAAGLLAQGRAEQIINGA